MDDFYDEFNGESVSELLAGEVKRQIMNIVKKDPKYKAFINKKADEMLNSLSV